MDFLHWLTLWQSRHTGTFHPECTHSGPKNARCSGPWSPPATASGPGKSTASSHLLQLRLRPPHKGVLPSNIEERMMGRANCFKFGPRPVVDASRTSTGMHRCRQKQCLLLAGLLSAAKSPRMGLRGLGIDNPSARVPSVRTGHDVSRRVGRSHLRVGPGAGSASGSGYRHSRGPTRQAPAGGLPSRNT